MTDIRRPRPSYLRAVDGQGMPVECASDSLVEADEWAQAHKEKLEEFLLHVLQQTEEELKIRTGKVCKLNLQLMVQVDDEHGVFTGVSTFDPTDGSTIKNY